MYEKSLTIDGTKQRLKYNLKVSISLRPCICEVTKDACNRGFLS